MTTQREHDDLRRDVLKLATEWQRFGKRTGNRQLHSCGMILLNRLADHDPELWQRMRDLANPRLRA